MYVLLQLPRLKYNYNIQPQVRFPSLCDMKNVPSQDFSINKIAFFNSYFNARYQSCGRFYYSEFSFVFWQIAGFSLKYNCISSVLYTHLNLWNLLYFKKSIINGQTYLVKRNYFDISSFNSIVWLWEHVIIYSERVWSFKFYIMHKETELSHN